MNLVDWVIGQPWAIHPAAASGLLALAGREMDEFRAAFAAAGVPESVDTRGNRSSTGNHSPTVRDGVGVIPVRGPIVRYANMMHDVCGGTSVQRLAVDLKAYADDPAVRAILLHVDSPGGQVTGTGELAAQIRAATGRKPVVAYAEGSCCSGAYWLASAAGILIASPTATLGSIGTIVQFDNSMPKGHVKFVSSQSPLKQDADSEEGVADLQAWVDAISDEFISAVASHRNTTPERVKSDFGRGGVKVGKAAVEAGMADAVGDFETTLSRLSRGEPAAPRKPTSDSKPAATAGAKPRFGASSPMNPFAILAKLWASDPAAVQAAADATEAGTADVAAILRAVPGVSAPDPAAVRAEIEARVKAESVTSNDAMFRTFYGEQASAWFDGQVAAGKAKPTEKVAAVARYVDAAMADRVAPLALADGSTMTRLSALTADVEGRSVNGLLTTHVAPNLSPAEVAKQLNGAAILPQAAGDPDEDAKAKAKASRMKAALSATPEGLAALAALAK